MVTQEFKNTRGLLPIKINILGPPGVGKTEIAKALAAHYRIHHVTAAEMIEEAKSQLGAGSKFRFFENYSIFRTNFNGTYRVKN